MELTPFGVLHEGYRRFLTGLYQPMKDWPVSRAASYRPRFEQWLDDVPENIWPSWKGDQWVGGSASTKEDRTKSELELAVSLYHGIGEGKDILNEVLDLPPNSDERPTTHRWHYNIEDALVHDLIFKFTMRPADADASFGYRASRGIGSNYLAYDPAFDIKKFENLFWGRMRRIQPPLWDIKQYFQRPRPWNAAAILDVKGFRWTVAGGDFVSHTGIHPSLLSGHCIQGILGGCSVYDALLNEGGTLDENRLRAIRQYMVDWGDRRVFAGVHYMTDNIASWTLARRLIPHLFQNSQQVEKFAVQAIIGHSRVFADIVKHFNAGSAARQMLLHDFPEADATN